MKLIANESGNNHALSSRKASVKGKGGANSRKIGLITTQLLKDGVSS